ncbi:MAG: penicillin-binding transpeptidase domain-containing protein, partial [bacterium]
GETPGLLPTPEWKQRVKREPWYIGDTYHLSIGQGDLLVTPLQMANATAAIANGGVVYQPRLVTASVTPDGKKNPISAKVLNDHPADRSSIETVRQGMREAVLSGSAGAMQALPVTSGAKTGTAQFEDGNATHAWFTAFAPYENPQIALAVIVEGAGQGHAAALPVAENVLNWYFSQQTRE